MTRCARQRRGAVGCHGWLAQPCSSTAGQAGGGTRAVVAPERLIAKCADDATPWTIAGYRDSRGFFRCFPSPSTAAAPALPFAAHGGYGRTNTTPLRHFHRPAVVFGAKGEQERYGLFGPRFRYGIVCRVSPVTASQHFCVDDAGDHGYDGQAAGDFFGECAAQALDRPLRSAIGCEVCRPGTPRPGTEVDNHATAAPIIAGRKCRNTLATPLMLTSIIRENSSTGTFQSSEFRLIMAALFTSRSGGPPERTSAAQTRMSSSRLTFGDRESVRRPVVAAEARQSHRPSGHSRARHGGGR